MINGQAEQSKNHYFSLAELGEMISPVDEQALEPSPVNDTLAAEYDGIGRILEYLRQNPKEKDPDIYKFANADYPNLIADTIHIPRAIAEVGQSARQPESIDSLVKLHHYGYAVLNILLNNILIHDDAKQVAEHEDTISRLLLTTKLQRAAYIAAEREQKLKTSRVDDVEEAHDLADQANFDRSLARAINMTGTESVAPLSEHTSRNRRFVFGSSMGHSELKFGSKPDGLTHRQKVYTRNILTRNRASEDMNTSTDDSLSAKLRLLYGALNNDQELLDAIKQTTGSDEEALWTTVSDIEASLLKKRDRQRSAGTAAKAEEVNATFLRRGAVEGMPVSYDEARLQFSEILPWDTYQDTIAASLDANGAFIPLPYKDPSVHIVRKNDIPAMVRGLVSAAGAAVLKPNLENTTKTVLYTDFKADRILTLSDALLKKYNGTVNSLSVRALPIDEEDFTSLGLVKADPETVICLTFQAELKGGRTTELSTYIYYGNNGNSTATPESGRLVATVRKDELAAAAKFVHDYIASSKMTARAVEARALAHPLRGGLMHGPR